jgi:VWFA-related protein
VTKAQKIGLRCALAISVGAAVVGPLLGQASVQTTGQTLSQTQSAPPAPPIDNNPIRVFTNEVVVPVTVTDATGEFVLDLTQQDFHVFDNGVEQKIDRWDLGGDPLAVVLVLETSSRLEEKMALIHSLGSIFTETVMALDGEAAVITYDSGVDVRQPFTQDHDAVAAAIANAPFEVPQRNLYDGMDRAVQMLKDEPPKWRRILLVVGESEDRGSKAKLGAVVRDAAHANITIYAVGPSSMLPDLIQDAGFSWAAPAIWLLQAGVNKSKNHALEVAAAATGGIHYGAIRAATLQSALDNIGGELHAQYIISYQPTPAPAPGFHAIHVTVSRPNVIVRARPGYYLAAAADGSEDQGQK